MKRALLGALALVAGGCTWESAEGRPWVHSILLEGVKKVKRGDLEDKLAIEKTSWNPLAAKRYLDPFAVAADEARIEAFYRARGYYAARVTTARVLPRKNGKSVDVRFVIVEGEPTRIREVVLLGIDDLPDPGRSNVRRLVDVKVGQIFDSDRYLMEKEILTATVKNLGYPWAAVAAEAEVDRDSRQATVRFTVTPGAHADFDGVAVVGTVAIDAKRVALEANVDPGQPFLIDTLDLARDRVYHLGVFSSVKVTYERVPAQPDRPERVRLKIKVKESTFNELRLGAGIDVDPGRNEVRLQAIYVRHNFLGGLRTLQLRLMPGYVAVPAVWNVYRHGPAVSAEAVVTQPRVSFLSRIEGIVGYDVGVEYAYQFHGPRTSLGATRLVWRDRLSFGLSYNFQILTFFNTDPAILQDPAQAGRVFGFVDPYRVGWWQQEIAVDLRDSPLDTRKGVYLLAGAEEGGSYTGGAFAYEKLRGEVRAYLPLGRRVVIAGRAQFGHLFVQGDLGSPITRRFYLGGSNSHRGFSYGRLSMQVPSGVPGQPPIPVGGDEMFLAQAEARVDLFRLAGNWLSAVAFYDTGDVGAPSCGSAACPLLTAAARTEIEFKRLHHAVGGGLRYKTVIGTLRADLGIRLNRLGATEADGLPNPDPGARIAFHLSVGEAF